MPALRAAHVAACQHSGTTHAPMAVAKNAWSDLVVPTGGARAADQAGDRSHLLRGWCSGTPSGDVETGSLDEVVWWCRHRDLMWPRMSSLHLRIGYRRRTLRVLWCVGVCTVIGHLL